MAKPRSSSSRRPAIGVTDHALVRWLERTGAMDVEALRGMLEATLERAAQAALHLEASKFLILADGMVFLVEQGKVITVVEDDGRHANLLAPDRD